MSFNFTVINDDDMHMIIFQVVLESLRMASIISFTFREAVVDVEYKGIFHGSFKN